MTRSFADLGALGRPRAERLQDFQQHLHSLPVAERELFVHVHPERRCRIRRQLVRGRGSSPLIEVHIREAAKGRFGRVAV